MKKVRDLMTKAVICCGQQSDLSEVATLMATHNCGVIPVTNENGKLVGIITDRDICLILAESGSDIIGYQVENCMKTDLHTCHPEDNVNMALKTMQTAKVKRLPVVDQNHIIKGIISLNDILFFTQSNEALETAAVIPTNNVLKVMLEIYRSAVSYATMNNS